MGDIEQTERQIFSSSGIQEEQKIENILPPIGRRFGVQSERNDQDQNEPNDDDQIEQKPDDYCEMKQDDQCELKPEDQCK